MDTVPPPFSESSSESIDIRATPSAKRLLELRRSLTYASSAVKNHWKGFAAGVISSLVASYLYTAQTAYVENAAYRRDALRELVARLFRTEQAIVMMFPVPDSARTALTVVEEFFNSTKSETGNPRFEGQRVENIIYNLK